MSYRWSIRRVEGFERAAVVRFMQAQFHQHFQASLKDDCDSVFGIYGADGELAGAFGLNEAPERFFSRHYIGDAELAVRNSFGAAGVAGKMVELSHFCVTTPSTVCRILPQLARFLDERADYIVCTVTRELARFFNRKELTSRQLGLARLASLPENERDGWGSYYEHDPVVLTGRLADACATLCTAPVRQPMPFYPASQFLERQIA